MNARLIHQNVEEWAARTPEATAFRCMNQALSYQDLARESARLCTVLRSQGVERGDRVGVFLHKSLHSAIAIYGIMRSGAAYVPIDPGAPAARVAAMLRHCGVGHLVTQPEKRDAVSEITRADTPLTCIVGLDGLEASDIECLSWQDVARAPEGPPARLIEEDLAYIMYTSGSTGHPKGITHTHASSLAYARAITALYGIESLDRLANHAPLHFDISLFEFVGGPLRGATTIILPEPHTKLPAALSELLERERATIWFSAPNALTQLLLHGAISKRDLTSLRWVIFGGEPFPPKYLCELMQAWPNARFSNSYGPAETNMCSYFHVEDSITPESASVPIGKMWDVAEGLIVDENNQPVRQGEIGELLVRSPTCMRGYWNAPELNARCFYHRAVAPGISDVFYRTGDLVIDHGDARMLFLGRKDRQIKLRGFRIELDEIEAILAADKNVEEAAAYMVQDGNAIEAAVTLANGVEMSPEDLRQVCAKRLPGYAVPDQVRILPEFPRTGSQKINRTALSIKFNSVSDE